MALGYDAKGLSPSHSALSSTGNHCSQSQLGLCQVGIRNQGHLNNGFKITPAPTSLKKRFAKPLGSKNQMTRGELGSAMPFSVLSVQFSAVAQSCPTLCDPMNHSMPGFPVHHQLPEFTQTHVHRVSDAIQPSHPLSSPSPPAPNPSQHQSLFQ